MKNLIKLTALAMILIVVSCANDDINEIEQNSLDTTESISEKGVWEQLEISKQEIEKGVKSVAFLDANRFNSSNSLQKSTFQGRTFVGGNIPTGTFGGYGMERPNPFSNDTEPGGYRNWETYSGLTFGNDISRIRGRNYYRIEHLITSRLLNGSPRGKIKLEFNPWGEYYSTNDRYYSFQIFRFDSTGNWVLDFQDSGMAPKVELSWKPGTYTFNNVRSEYNVPVHGAWYRIVTQGYINAPGEGFWRYGEQYVYFY